MNPKKLYPYDLKSAKQLTQQPVWVKEGYRYTYFAYQPASKHVDFGHDAGLLGPIEKLAITDVVVASNIVSGQPKQVVATFQKEGKSLSHYKIKQPFLSQREIVPVEALPKAGMLKHRLCLVYAASH